MPKDLPHAWLTLFAHDAPPTTPPATGEAPPAAPPAGQTSPSPPATGEAPPATPEGSLGDPGKAALQAERKARSDAERLNRELSARVKAFEDAQKSAEQKMADDLAAAQAEAAKATAELLQLRIVNEVGVPADLAEFVTGADEAELRARAQKLKAALPAPTTPPAPPRSSGLNAGGESPSPTDYRKATDSEVDAELRKLGVTLHR